MVSSYQLKIELLALLMLLFFRPLQFPVSLVLWHDSEFQIVTNSWQATDFLCHRLHRHSRQEKVIRASRFSRGLFHAGSSNHDPCIFGISCRSKPLPECFIDRMPVVPIIIHLHLVSRFFLRTLLKIQSFFSIFYQILVVGTRSKSETRTLCLPWHRENQIIFLLQFSCWETNIRWASVRELWKLSVFGYSKMYVLCQIEGFFKRLIIN